MAQSKYIYRPLIVSILLAVVLLLSAQDTAQRILDKVSRQYRSALPFKIGFTIRQEMSDGKNYSATSGTFFLNSRGCFRVNFTDQEIVYDLQWLWTRDKVNRQVVVEEFNPRSSLKLVSDLLNGSLTTYRIVKMTKKKTGLTILELEPLTENGYIRSMQLTIDQNLGTIKTANYRDFQNNQISAVLDTLAHLSATDSSCFNIGLKTDDELIDLRP